jgi:hypothetical protein
MAEQHHFSTYPSRINQSAKSGTGLISHDDVLYNVLNEAQSASGLESAKLIRVV